MLMARAAGPSRRLAHAAARSSSSSLAMLRGMSTAATAGSPPAPPLPPAWFMPQRPSTSFKGTNTELELEAAAVVALRAAHSARLRQHMTRLQRERDTSTPQPQHRPRLTERAAADNARRQLAHRFCSIDEMKARKALPGQDVLGVVRVCSGEGSLSFDKLASHLAAVNMIALDCEFAGSRLCLIQLMAPAVCITQPAGSTMPGGAAAGGSRPRASPLRLSRLLPDTVYLIDTVEAPPEAARQLAALLAGVMADPGVAKVTHGGIGDIRLLTGFCGPEAAPFQNVMDTQVVFTALRTLERTGSLPRSNLLTNTPKLEKVLHAYGFNQPFTSRVPRPYMSHPTVTGVPAGEGASRHDHGPQLAKWEKRPLPQSLADYAVTDSRYLLALMLLMQQEVAARWRPEVAAPAHPLGLLQAVHGRYKAYRDYHAAPAEQLAMGLALMGVAAVAAVQAAATAALASLARLAAQLRRLRLL